MNSSSAHPTAREIEVLRVVLHDGSVAHAAEPLFLSKHTVDRHVDSLREKSGKHHWWQIVLWALRNGFLDEDEVGA